MNMHGYYIYAPSLKVRMSDYFSDVTTLQQSVQCPPGCQVRYKRPDDAPIPEYERKRKANRPPPEAFIPMRGAKRHTSMTPNECWELSEIATRQIFRDTVLVTDELIAKPKYKSGMAALLDMIDRMPEPTE